MLLSARATNDFIVDNLAVFGSGATCNNSHKIVRLTVSAVINALGLCTKSFTFRIKSRHIMTL